MDRQQVMFVETQGQVLNRLKASLTGAHADWQILFMADASAALDLICRRKVGIVLANFGMDTVGCEEFFSSLRKKAPEVIRTSLLPYQAKKNRAKSLEYAHECIAAHCDLSKMENVITRSLYVWEKARRIPRLAEMMSNLQEDTELTDTEGQAGTPSMFDGLLQLKRLLEKLVEQGLNQPPATLWKP